MATLAENLNQDRINSLVLSAQSVNKIKASDPKTSAFVNSLDMKEPATYKTAMAGFYAKEWSKSLHEEMNSLMQNTNLSKLKM